MALKMKKVEYFEVSYKDLEDFIIEVFGLEPGPRGFNICACEEWGNSSQHSFVVEGYGRNADEEDDLKQFVESNGCKPQYITQLLLEELCRRGLIPAGEYLVRVAW